MIHDFGSGKDAPAELQVGRKDSGPKEPCVVTYVLDDREVQGVSMHFNEHGILVLCEQVLPLNKKVKLSLKFPELKTVIEVQGEVVWTNMYGPDDSLSPRGMGIKFTSLDRDAQRLLIEMATQYDVLTSVYSCYFS